MENESGGEWMWALGLDWTHLWGVGVGDGGDPLGRVAHPTPPLASENLDGVFVPCFGTLQWDLFKTQQPGSNTHQFLMPF